MSNLVFKKSISGLVCLALALSMGVGVSMISPLVAVADPKGPSDGVIDELITNGVSLPIAGGIREMADLPASEGRFFLGMETGQLIRLRDADVTEDLLSLKTVTLEVGVPGEVIEELDASQRKDLAEASGLELLDKGIVEGESEAADLLVEAITTQNAELAVERVVNRGERLSAIQAPTTTGSPHRVDVVFMSVGGGQFFSKATLDGYIGKLEQYWVRESRGAITGFDYPEVTSMKSQAHCTLNLSKIQAAALEELGSLDGLGAPRLETVYYGDNTRRHLIIITPIEDTVCNNTNYAGVTSIGKGFSSGGIIHVQLSKSWTVATGSVFDSVAISHEFGHNFALEHAGTATCPTGVVDGIIGPGKECDMTSSLAYADYMNIMGNSYYALASPLNGAQKERLGIIKEGAGLKTIEGNGSYDITLKPASTTNPDELQSLRIINTSSSATRVYSIDYHSENYQFGGSPNGVAFRRVRDNKKDVTSANWYSDTILLAKGGTKSVSMNRIGEVVFRKGDTFTSASGNMTVGVTEIDTNGAHLHIEINEPSALLPASVSEVSVDGVPVVGQSVSALVGSYSPSGASLSYQWLRDGVPIVGAADSEYTPVAADAGLGLSVEVTVSATGYVSASGVSAAKPVAKGTLAAGVVTITGVPSIGQSLGVDVGAWVPALSDFSYVWLRDGVPIVGASGASYVLQTSDAGKQISVEVTGSLNGYDGTASVSSPVSVGVLPASVGEVSVVGVPVVGQSVSALVGSYSPSGALLSYQWLRGGVPIVGAVESTYTPIAADAGLSLSVEVTVSAVGYDDAASVSSPVSVGVLPASVGEVSVVGVPVVGQPVTALVGSYSPSGALLSYQWLRGGVPIVGAVDSGYTPVAADAGLGLSVEVTVSAAGYGSVAGVSVAKLVTKGVLAAGVVTVTGVPSVGLSLGVDVGIWSPAPTSYTYQWLREGNPITGAIGANYTLVATDIGKDISVRLTGFLDGYDSPTVESTSFAIPLGTIPLGTITIIGSPEVGKTLKADVGAALPSGVNLTYQWYRGATPIPSATTDSLALTVDDLGTEISVRVRATLAGHSEASAKSDSVTVRAGTFSGSAPIVKGNPVFGTVLGASAGTWDIPNVTVSYQWLKDGQPIAGATTNQYLLGESATGHQISVRVTGRATGYADAVTVSAQLSVPTIDFIPWNWGTYPIVQAALTNPGKADIYQMIVPPTGNYSISAVASLAGGTIQVFNTDGNKVADVLSSVTGSTIVSDLPAGQVFYLSISSLYTGTRYALRFDLPRPGERLTLDPSPSPTPTPTGLIPSTSSPSPTPSPTRSTDSPGSTPNSKNVIIVRSNNQNSEGFDPSYLLVGKTTTLKVWGAEGYPITWSASTGGVLSVSSSGVVTALKAGTALVTATVGNNTGIVKTFWFTVEMPIKAIKASVKTLYVVKGKSVKIPIVAYPQNAKTVGKVTVSWKSAKSKIATITSTASTTSMNGKGTALATLAKGKFLTVKALKKGTTIITVTSLNGVKLKLKIAVVAKTNAKAVEKVKITSKANTLEKDKTKTLNVKTGPAKATSAIVKWKSSNNKIATVDAAGLLTANKKGTVKITATSRGEKTTKTIKIK